MASQQELRILLRATAEDRGVTDMRRSLDGLRGTAVQTGTSAAGLVRFGAAAGAAGVAATAVIAAVQNMSQGLGESIGAAAAATRMNRTLAVSYGAATPDILRLAASLRTVGVASNEVIQSAQTTATLVQNYGITTDQISALITRTTDLATAQGKDLPDSVKRVSDAIRGEAESAEQLGLTLNASFLAEQRRNQGLSDSYDALTQNQRAQIVFNEFMRQSAQFVGQATAATKELDGALRVASVAADDSRLAFGELISPLVTAGLEAQAAAFDLLSVAIRGTRDAAKEAQPPLMALLPAMNFLSKPTTAPTLGQPVEISKVTDLRRAVDELTGINTAAVLTAEDLRRAMDEITRVSLPTGVTVQRILPHIIDEAARAADVSVNRLTRDLQVLQGRSGELGTLLDALGTGIGQDAIRAELQAEQGLQRIEAVLTARLAAGERRRQLEEQARISDPRDAPGARVARERLRLLDELEPRERALIEAQRVQNDLQREAVRLQAQEAAAMLRILPQREGLQDLQDQLERDRLVLQNLRASPDERRAALRESIDIQLNRLPAAELAAFDAERGLRPIQRAGERNRLLGQIAGAGVSSREQDLQEAIQRGIEAGIAAATKANPTQVALKIEVSTDGGASQVFDQLIEANGQAQSPPVIQVSGVRR